jgi:methionyl-tRNA formyltransferase
MRVIFFGTPLFAVPTLERLLDHDLFDVVGVVTQPDKRRGRGKQLIPSAVKKVAQAHDLQVWQPSRIKKNSDTITQLQAAKADIFVVVAYGQILSQEILSIPPYGCINVHASLLPKYRGAAPIQWCLYHGERETGVTTMQMDVGMDTGDMLLKVHLPLLLTDNAQDVAINLSSIGADLLIETLLKLQHGAITPTPQNEDEATYAPLIGKKDYELDWTKTAIALHNQVRGFYPNCVTTFRDQLLKVKATAPLGEVYWSQLPEEIQVLTSQGEQMTAQPRQIGEVVYIAKGLGAVIQTGEGLLLLTEVQLAGKRTQSGWDFANGTRLEVGEKLE